MSRAAAIYIAATRQNDGKTTTALGLFNAISERVSSVGYIKPVGQQVRLVDNREIDKDADLMSRIFQIGIHLYDMSPLAISTGFTENFITHGDAHELEERILTSYMNASGGKDFMVIEGTGHAGVGSVIDLSNAAVAKLLGAPVIIVTGGGIGRPIDEAMLNKAVFDQHGIDVVGVIVNKVIPEKYEKINRLVRLGFERKGIKVLGVIPFYPDLASPTMLQVVESLGGELLCGEGCMDVTVSNIIVRAMPPNTALDYFTGDVLLITPGNREDLILAALACCVFGIKDEGCVRGMLLTGGILPQKTILRLLKQSNIPVILVKDDTFVTAQKLTNLIIKVRPEDFAKIDKIKEMIKEYVDVGWIVDHAGLGG